MTKAFTFLVSILNKQIVIVTFIQNQKFKYNLSVCFDITFVHAAVYRKIRHGAIIYVYTIYTYSKQMCT